MNMNCAAGGNDLHHENGENGEHQKSTSDGDAITNQKNTDNTATHRPSGSISSPQRKPSPPIDAQEVREFYYTSNTNFRKFNNRNLTEMTALRRSAGAVLGLVCSLAGGLPCAGLGLRYGRKWLSGEQTAENENETTTEGLSLFQTRRDLTVRHVSETFPYMVLYVCSSGSS